MRNTDVVTTTHTLDTFLQQDDEKEITEIKKEKLPTSLARFYTRRFFTCTLIGAALLFVAVGLLLDASTPEPLQMGGVTAVMVLLFAASVPLSAIGIFGLAATGIGVVVRNITRGYR
jgi:hypothetical protein